MAKREKKATVGERIALRYIVRMGRECDDGPRAKFRIRLGKSIDAAIKRAVREAWAYATNDGSTPTNMWNRKHIAAKYGVNL